MNKITLILITFPLLVFAQTKFSKGYSKGYKIGYCYEVAGCNAPDSPVSPIPNTGYDSYQDGYNRGFSDGKLAMEENSNTGTFSNEKKKTEVNLYIDQNAINIELIGDTSSAGNEPVNLGYINRQMYNSSESARNEREAEKRKRIAAMSPSSTEIIVPLTINLNNFTHIAIVDAKNYNSLHKKIKRVLSMSILKAIHPKKYDKKKYRKNKFFLESIKNPQWIYLYHKTLIKKYDFIRTIVLKNSGNEIIYQSKTINVSSNENLSDIFNY